MNDEEEDKPGIVQHKKLGIFEQKSNSIVQAHMSENELLKKSVIDTTLSPGSTTTTPRVEAVTISKNVTVTTQSNRFPASLQSTSQPFSQGRDCHLWS